MKDHTQLEFGDIVDVPGNPVGPTTGSFQVPARYKIVALSRGPTYENDECEYYVEHVSGPNLALMRTSLEAQPFLRIDASSWGKMIRLVDFR